MFNMSLPQSLTELGTPLLVHVCYISSPHFLVYYKRKSPFFFFFTLSQNSYMDFPLQSPWEKFVVSSLLEYF